MTFRRILLGLTLGGVLVWAVAASQLQQFQLQRWRSQESETVRMLGLMRARVLSEVSGLAVASGPEPQLWMHNDSGDRPRLFLVSTQGKLLQEVGLDGAQHRDWEDLCRLNWNGTPHLLVGDVGDNAARRESCQLYLLPEPPRVSSDAEQASPAISVSAQRIDFRYADGPRNCESLGFDPQAKGVLLIEKLVGNAPESESAGVYFLDLQALASPTDNSPSDNPRTESTLVAQRIGNLPWRNITALDLSADGQRLFVRTYFEGYLFEKEAAETWAARLQRQLPEPLQLPVEAQGEAVCFSADASSVLLTSEFAFQPLWELRLPEPNSSAVAAQQASPVTPAAPSQEEVKRLILPGESFLCADRPAFILWPPAELRSDPQPWIFYAPTLPPYPDEAEKWMHQQFLEAGIAVAGIDVGEAYGSPAAREVFETFYQEVTKQRGLAARPCLLGRSRGGLWVSSWAADHPERFAGLAGIYPVFDWRTYPGVERAAGAYGLTAKQLAERADELNPIARAEKLAKAGLPVFIIHGDQDTVVPLAENSAALADAYRRAGAEAAIELVIAKGQGHNMWEGFFRCQELIDFAISRAKSGAQGISPNK